MQIAFLTDKGVVREKNEDSLFVDNDIGLFLVADGMGGHQAGEVASEMAVRIITSKVRNRISNSNGTSQVSLIKESISLANNKIFATSDENPHLVGMGTTIVIALLEKNVVHIANVGDGRAYLVRSDNIEQLTEDHSLVAELLQVGQITKEEARVHPKRNIVTMAVGMEKIEPTIKSIETKKDDYILLCTDGLTDMLGDEEIRDIITTPNSSLNEKCRELIDEANRKGGKDNITILLINIEGKEDL